MATILREKTGYEKEINKLTSQLNVLKRIRSFEKIFFIAINALAAIIGFILLFQLQPALGFVGLVVAYVVSDQLLKPFLKPRMHDMTRRKNMKLQALLQRNQGEKSVAQKIANKAKGDYYLINNMSVSKNDRISHVLVCPDNTIVCLETHNIEGRFRESDQGWQRTFDYKNETIKDNGFTNVKKKAYNNALQLSHQLQLSEHINIVPIIVMVNKQSKWEGKQDAYCPIMRIESLIDYINHHFASTTANQHQLKTTTERLMKIA